MKIITVYLKVLKLMVLALSLLLTISLESTKSLPSTAALICFSYHRPLQLFSFLESLNQLTSNVKPITIIYRADEDIYEKAYQQVEKHFQTVRFIKQPFVHPRSHFKSLLIKEISRLNTEYILFAVDDIIIKDSVDITVCIQALEATGAYGFYLRLGKHVTHCYSENSIQGIPPLVPLSNNIFSWMFEGQKGDWNYPNSLDMTLFRKKTVLGPVLSLEYDSPNTLEAQWARLKLPFSYQGLCFDDSKIINIPLNIIQSDYIINKHMNNYTVQDLLNVFNKGLKIDITPLLKIKNLAAHIEYNPTFIKR